MKQKQIILLSVLVIVGFFVYAFNLNNALFWDDDDWIKNNIFVHDFSHIKEIFTQNILSGFGLNSNYYRPFLLLTFALNYAIGGIAPLGYHLINNGLHIANGLLIFLILTTRRVVSRRAAFLAALLFIIHPLQTEAVTYISGRGDPMSVFFMLLALLLFIKHLNLKTFVSDIASRTRLAMSLIFLVLAILSRETASLFPLFAMIFYISFLDKNRFLTSFKNSIVKTLPFWAVSVSYFILRLTVFNFNNTLNFYSQANQYSQHLSYRIYTFGSVLVSYFKLIFLPLGLHMERDVTVNTSLFQWPVWLGVILVAALVAIGVLFYRKSKLTTSDVVATSDVKIWFFGWGWFFVALAPVSGIVPINAIIYEHWLYLPLIGFFVFAGFYISKLLNYLKPFKPIYVLLVMFMVFYFSFFSVASAKRNTVWGDPIKFYEDTLKYNPGSIRILNNLGNLYSEKGNLKRAEEIYMVIISDPVNTFPQPYHNLANLYRDQGKIQEAIYYYEKAIEIDPSFPFAYQNLAVMYANGGKAKEAIEVLEKLKIARPDIAGIDRAIESLRSF